MCSLSRKNSIICKTCLKDILPSGVRVVCEECTNVSLCVDCFCQGCELGGHKNWHKYSVIEEVNEPLFDDNSWVSSQDIRLLEAIQKFGVGNWDGVAAMVNEDSGSNFRKRECENHFKAMVKHIAGPEFEWNERDDAPWPDPLDHLPIHPSLIEANVGFRPKRRDFEIVWCNDAERTLADMEIQTDDQPLERQLKLKAIEIYNRRLDERESRKEFLIRRGLNYGREKKRGKSEKEIYLNVCRFARFVSKQEHDRFVQGLVNEHRLRERIAQLQHWRVLGIRSITAGNRYERDRRRRDGSVADSRPVSLGAQKRSLKRILDTVTTDRQAKKRAKHEKKQKDAGYESLTETEQRLCSELGITSTQWLSIRNTVKEKVYLHGLLNPGVTKQLLHVDLSATSQIQDTVVKIGWTEPKTLPNTG